VPKVKPRPPTPDTIQQQWRELLAHMNDVAAEAAKAIAQSKIQREKLAEVRKTSGSIREKAAALRAARAKSDRKKFR
jgi:hypothetical protein